MEGKLFIWPSEIISGIRDGDGGDGNFSPKTLSVGSPTFAKNSILGQYLSDL